MSELVKPNWVAFGRLLREGREEAGLSRRELARRASCAESLVSKVESAKRRVSAQVAAQLGQVLGAAEELEEARKKAERADRHPWNTDIVEHEAEAVHLKAWAPLIIPGIVQTPEYAAAVFRDGRPGIEEDSVTSLVAARLARSEIALQREVWIVVDETALLRRVGRWPEVMAGQIRHLMRLASTQCKITVLPADCEYSGGLSGPIYLAQMSDHRMVAYAEHISGGDVLADPDAILRIDAIWREITAWALSPAQSLTVMKESLKVMEG
ncbi:helix-turn-helix domain-containing protein [Nocardiopsis changdeensis]|uniref:helix-turn-helix domain-containing protein n=1 Tax=Nocardiopsis changdeensis TaxID=2831969 RepID=UPI003F478FE6